MNIDQIIYINPIPLYKHYNATTDWQKQNPRWMYTAISRTKCMWNVHFLAMSLYSIDEKYKLFKAQQIVIGNKHQDKLAGRAHEGPDYVTPEWVVREYNKCDICPGQPGKHCRKTMSFEDHHQHKVTINRKHTRINPSIQEATEG